MKATFRMLAIAAFSSLLFSCQKEYSYGDGDSDGGVAPIDFTGTWDILQMGSSGYNTVTASVSGITSKTKTTYTYFTRETSGKMLVDDKTFTAQDFAYIIDTTMHVEMITAGIPVGEMDMPLYLQMPPTTTPMPYRKISGDSVVLKGAVTSSPTGNIGSIEPQEMGFRLRMSGDTLIMAGTMQFNMSQDIGGTTANIEGKVTNIMKLKRP